jgi:hypothetical protein
LGTLAYNDREVARAVRHGRPIRVIPLEEVLSRIRRSFERALMGSYLSPEPEPSQQLRAADERAQYKP